MCIGHCDDVGWVAYVHRLCVACIDYISAGFTVLFWVTVAANTLGNYAYLAATPNTL